MLKGVYEAKILALQTKECVLRFRFRHRPEVNTTTRPVESKEKLLLCGAKAA